MTDYNSLLAACHKPFKHWELTTNYKGHLYASVQATQARLNNLGVPWDLVHNSLVVERYKKMVKNKTTKEMEERTYYDAFCSVQLSIEGLGTRCGTGADDNEDSDTATKSALAYALRKAGNQFGIAWYITDKPAEEVALWNHLSGADITDIADVKKAVKMVAAINDTHPQEWLTMHGVTDNSNVGYLVAALKEDGRL